MSGAGAVSNTVGSYYSSLSQKRALKLQATLAEINAKIADSNARGSLSRGEKTEQKARLENAALKSRQRVAYASGGVDLSSDSVVDTLTSTDVLGEIDANQIKAAALREAWGHRFQGVGLRNEARMARASASAISPALNAATTFIGEASQVAGQYYGMKKSGALGGGKTGSSKAGGTSGSGGSFFGGLKGL